MEQKNFPDRMAEERLEELGISSLLEWDVLVFLYRHRLSMGDAAQIGWLLGYPANLVEDALDRIESLGLVQVSRASRGVRLYRCAISGNHPRDGAFQQLYNLVQDRIGRLAVAKQLWQGDCGKQGRDRVGSSFTVKRGTKWPKAV